MSKKVYYCGACGEPLKDDRRYYCNQDCFERLARGQRTDEDFLFVCEYDDGEVPRFYN
jgi:hypothetical protein